MKTETFKPHKMFAGIDANIFTALYFLIINLVQVFFDVGILVALLTIVLLVLEKKSKLLRFLLLQNILTQLILLLVSMLFVSLAFIPFVALVLVPLSWVLYIVTMFFGFLSWASIYFAYTNRTLYFPLVGRLTDHFYTKL